MDRNNLHVMNATVISKVALRKESVDRNKGQRILFLNMLVALRKESVDRNYDIYKCCWRCLLSLSARRAWIEIKNRPFVGSSAASLSARRAWIEIGLFGADTVSY